MKLTLDPSPIIALADNDSKNYMTLELLCKRWCGDDRRDFDPPVVWGSYWQPPPTTMTVSLVVVICGGGLDQSRGAHHDLLCHP
jgi:hypothetical protein